jgi:hypothetical protein
VTSADFALALDPRGDGNSPGLNSFACKREKERASERERARARAREGVPISQGVWSVLLLGFNFKVVTLPCTFCKLRTPTESLSNSTGLLD